MKKLLLALVALLMVAGCSSKTETPAATDTTATTETTSELKTGTYTVYNTTGAKLTDLYLYEVGAADKGTNYAADGIKNNKKVVLTYEGYNDDTNKTVLTLEFAYEGGETQKFETLHIEEAPIALKSVDAAAGATAINFAVPTETGVYTITNSTGQDVTAIYMYPAGSEKGDNKLTENLADGATFGLTYADGEIAQDYVFEFVTADEVARTFDTLHMETASFELLSVDAAAGATNIKFGY